MMLQTYIDFEQSPRPVSRDNTTVHYEKVKIGIILLGPDKTLQVKKNLKSDNKLGTKQKQSDVMPLGT